MINKNKKTNGMTLLEIIIATGLLGIVASITTSIMFNMQENNSLMEASNLMKNRDQSALNKMGKDISASKMFIGRIPTTGSPYQYGTDYYLPKISLPVNFKLTGLDNMVCSPLVPTSRVLPMIKTNLSFSPLDVGNPALINTFDISAVGNTLFFASVNDSINADYILSPSGDARKKTIDLIQFNYYYIAKSSKLGPNGEPYLFLMKWQSDLYLNYKQIADTLLIVQSGQQANFFNSIKAAKPIGQPTRNIAGVWNQDRKGPCDTSAGNNYFYTLGTSSFTNTDCNSYKILTYKNDRATLVDGYMSGITYSLERNNNFSGISKVPKYALAENFIGDNFPHGFEVMIGGDSGARKVLTRIVRKANRASGRSVYSETSSLFQGADL